MPSSTITEHKNLTMTFTEADHSYIDSKNRRYTSVTTLISFGFEKFDSERIAKAKAAREGGDWKELVQEWAEKGKMAADLGTRIHENCENQILGKVEKMHLPVNISEKINFDFAYKAVEKIKNNHHYVKLEPEKIIFSPILKLAGSIDLLVTKDDGSYIIYDWKNVKGITNLGFNGKTGILECTKNIQDSNYWHYALQLQIYEIILKVEEYIPKNAKVKRVLNVFEGGVFNQYDLPSMKDAATGLIKWNCNRK